MSGYRRVKGAAVPVLTIWMLAVVGAACGGAESDPWLAALRKERLATMALPGGKLVLNAETKEHTSLGKPISARILRVYAFSDPRQATVSRDNAIKAATASGWRINPNRIDSTGPYYGSKKLSPGDATLTIGNFTSDGVPKVSIQLDQGACPAELCGR